MENVRMGVIGLGSMGTAHAVHIAQGQVEGMTLSAVCDSDPERCRWGREKFPEIPVFENAGELLASGAVDAVLIATPHPAHPFIAMEAFHHGIHVLTEKPEGIDVLTAAQENKEAQKSGVVFGIMYNQRTNPLFRRLHDLMQDGTMGELLRFQWTITNWFRTQAYYDSGSWRATWNGEGGGVLMNQCPHNLDIWQWITGMPQKIQAHCQISRYHDIQVEDAADIYAEYANGAVASFITTTGEYPGTNRLELVGSRGKAVIENGILRLSLLGKDVRTAIMDEEECMPELPVQTVEVHQTEPESGHVGILNDFSRAVRTGSALLAPGIEGIRGLSIANAAYLSSWTDSWVELPLDGERYLRELRKRQERCRTGKTDPANPHRSLTGEYQERWKVRW